MDSLAAAIAGIEVEVLTAPTRDTLRRMYELRHDVLKTRRVLAPQQDVIHSLATYELQPINTSNRLYFRELADRFAQMAETVDTQREYLRGAMLTHLSVVANQTHNLLRRVMVMVAIISPLTLLAVLYASSLKAIPVLSALYVDIVAVGTILLIAAMLAISRRSQ